MDFRTLEWVGAADGFLELIDQRKLPAEFVKLKCTTIEDVYTAIKTLAVRGAPAIGVAAAYGLLLGLQKPSAAGDMMSVLKDSHEYLASARPTAVNLFWALDRVSQKAQAFITTQPDATPKAICQLVLDEANAICREDIDMCRRIGENGEKFIKAGAGVLTHCNAGALATAGSGTALSLLFAAHKRSRKFKVYADETRPLLQGARLTAWELMHEGIDVTVICDNMAAWLMKQRKIDLVVTGADRIAANGDAANKIGTYGLSILAREHDIPFYIAAPSSTFDLTIKDGSHIPIEERDAGEIRYFNEKQITPPAAKVYNPAFDVTSAADITAIITERGVIESPTPEKIARLLRPAD
jgi:methylthioribose-1-phosphate isomerase